LKWGQPCYTFGKSNVAILQGLKEYCALMFFKGALLKVDFSERRELALPEELRNRLDETPALKAAVEALTPGRRRAYVLHFSAPKQSTTRASRVEKYMPRILDGRGLHD
jgi:uncharacterized protein YdeI (YjbR/CyaY-like superfamily)